MPTTEQFLQALAESTETLYDFDTDYTPRCVTVVNPNEWDSLPDELRKALRDAFVAWLQDNNVDGWASIPEDGGLFLVRAATPEEQADDLLACATISVRLDDGLTYEERRFLGDEPGCSAWRHCDDLGGEYAEDDPRGGLTPCAKLVADNVTFREALIAAYWLPRAARAYVLLPDGGEVAV